ncbi:hypothetical protein [Glycomyces salinus]|uniref:hypothetical protein n=1 Tax=Glycomyces salinus TaxID=980294 RepID=UPI0018EAD7FA|nr:hypothetical protein [Glycomyces salinus]
MNTEYRGDDPAETGDEPIRSAFDAYRAEAPANFPPGSVDDLLMSGPAKLRRRRIVSMAAVVGACTALTAGGFAVAQTLGSIPKQTAQEEPPAASQGTVEATDDEPELGDPFSPEVSEETDEGTDDETGDQVETTIVLDEWGEDCEGGEYLLDFSTWEFGEDTEWTVRQSVVADVSGGEAREAVLALTCGERTAVAVFSPDGNALEHLGWVWRQPDESQELSEIEDVDDGVITLQGLGEASETWTARYEWDGAAFVEIDDEPTSDPSPSEETDTPDTDETQTPSTDSTNESPES